MTEELWRWVPGSEGRYAVSNHGRVRSHLRRSPHIMRPARNRLGYYHLTIEKRDERVHRLVAAAFLGPGPGQLVRHLDGDPSNNHIANLAYGTQADNMQDAVRHGRLTGWNARKTECKNGHPFSEENTRIDSKGRRDCKTCSRVYERQWRRRRGAKPRAFLALGGTCGRGHFLDENTLGPAGEGKKYCRRCDADRRLTRKKRTPHDRTRPSTETTRPTPLHAANHTPAEVTP